MTPDAQNLDEKYFYIRIKNIEIRSSAWYNNVNTRGKCTIYGASARLSLLYAKIINRKERKVGPVK